RAGGTGVSGRNALWKSPGDGGRVGDSPASARASGDLPATRKTIICSGGGRTGQSQRARRAAHCEPRRLNAYMVLPAGRGNGLGFGVEIRYTGLCWILPGHARPRNLSAALAV